MTMKLAHRYDGEGVVFELESERAGAFKRWLGERRKGADLDAWAEGDARRCDALGALRTYGDERPGEVDFADARITASHAAVAALSASQAHALALPSPPPYALSTDVAGGPIGSRGFRLAAVWLDSGRRIAARRVGAFLLAKGDEHVIPEPLFSAVALADGFDAGDVELDGHWDALLRFRRLLTQDGEPPDAVRMSRFLADMRIHTAASLSLSVREQGKEVDFDPVLFDGDAAAMAADEGRALTERDAALPQELMQAFQSRPNTGFRAFKSAKRSYLLDANTYLILDKELEAALQVVREKQQAPAAERRAFADNPRIAIAERLASGEVDDDAAEDLAALTVVETMEYYAYADRAIGEGEWEEPVLAFLPHESNVWLPESFSLNLDGVWVRLDKDSVAELRDAVRDAVERSVKAVEWQGQSIPATQPVLDRLCGIAGREWPRTDEAAYTVRNEGEPPEAMPEGADDWTFGMPQRPWRNSRPQHAEGKEVWMAWRTITGPPRKGAAKRDGWTAWEIDERPLRPNEQLGTNGGKPGQQKGRGKGAGRKRRAPSTEQPPKRKPTVVVVRENFIEENWSPPCAPRQVRLPSSAPQRVSTPLLEHQSEALAWQIDAWRAGHPGVLNADDQGLGKTLQTLAFLAWLQSGMEDERATCRLPLLVVAPKSLLRTWAAEADKHLDGERLGARFDAFGQGLKDMRKAGTSGKDTDCEGAENLDFQHLQTAIADGRGHRCWMLTTYETLANYQRSFRSVEFAAVVFDEIQKIKNVRTLASLSARSLKADFRIGLTGTPIENHLSDLWAIMDAVAPGSRGKPGRLGTLQGFMERYAVVTEGRMKELHSRLFERMLSTETNSVYPPIAQRRMKNEAIKSLPRKDFRLYPTPMPDAQKDAYDEARRHLGDGAHGAALKMLHHVRGVSLHPEALEGKAHELDIGEYVAQSARFQAFRLVLRRIRDADERILIFTEDKRMQGFVAQWLRSEFRLSPVRIINGATTIQRREAYVSEFQRHLEQDGGFDAMILSPRAAGVGLTLTAATHVVHLSRWWNPAVEEQCNDRIYRIGQARDVVVHIPMAVHPEYQERSFDCVLNDLMRRKTALARSALWPPVNKDYDDGELVAGIAGAKPFNPSEVDDLDWAEFEQWVVRRALDDGAWLASETPPTGDAGADAVLHHSTRRDAHALVQVKHTTLAERLQDESAVRDLICALGQYDVKAPQLVAITNAAGFTETAQQLALTHGVILVDRDRLGLWPSHVLG